MRRSKQTKGLTTSTTGIRDITCVLEERSLFGSKRWSNPVGFSCGKLFLRHIDIQGIGLGVDGNDVSILDKGDRSSNLSLRNDMTYNKSVRSSLSALSVILGRRDIPATESTVGQTGDIVS